MAHPKIYVMAPGKCGTTFLGSLVVGARVIHEAGPSRFLLLRIIKRLHFYAKVMFYPTIVLLPFRDDKSRKESIFWNDFERAIYHFMTSHREEFRIYRYENYNQFLVEAFRRYPYENYESWWKRNWLNRFVRREEKNDLAISKKFRATFVQVPIGEFEKLKCWLELQGCELNTEAKFNRRDEFWHSVMHDSELFFE